jgi:hypothetical protein
MKALMAAAVCGGGKREGEGVMVAIKSIEDGGGRRGEGGERVQEMGGRRACDAVGKTDDWRWKTQLIGGAHLSVAGERERRERLDRAGVGELGQAALGRVQERRGEEKKREVGWAGERGGEREVGQLNLFFLFFPIWVLHLPHAKTIHV